MLAMLTAMLTAMLGHALWVGGQVHGVTHHEYIEVSLRRRPPTSLVSHTWTIVAHGGPNHLGVVGKGRPDGPRLHLRQQVRAQRRNR